MTGPDRPAVVPILLYHSLTVHATPSYRRFAVDPGRFREQMEVLATSGLRTLTVAELGAALARSDPAALEGVALVTFDDGFDEVHGLALPILERLGLRATAFIVTGYIGGRSEWLRADDEADRSIMGWTQLRELSAHGVEIGSHTHGHRELDTLARGAMVDEIRRPRAILEDGLGVTVESLAYPYGYHSGGIKRAVTEAGYRTACGVKHAFSHAADDRLALGRIIVDADTEPERFSGWLEGRGLARAWAGERWQTVVWRGARRIGARVGMRPVAPAAPG